MKATSDGLEVTATLRRITLPEPARFRSLGISEREQYSLFDYQIEGAATALPFAHMFTVKREQDEQGIELVRFSYDTLEDATVGHFMFAGTASPLVNESAGAPSATNLVVSALWSEIGELLAEGSQTAVYALSVIHAYHQPEKNEERNHLNFARVATEAVCHLADMFADNPTMITDGLMFPSVKYGLPLETLFPAWRQTDGLGRVTTPLVDSPELMLQVRRDRHEARGVLAREGLLLSS